MKFVVMASPLVSFGQYMYMLCKKKQVGSRQRQVAFFSSVPTFLLIHPLSRPIYLKFLVKKHVTISVQYMTGL